MPLAQILLLLLLLAVPHVKSDARAYLGAFETHGVGVSSSWSFDGESRPDDISQFFVGLKNQVSHAQLHALLLEVSTPSSISYGKYWSLERVQSEIWASPATRETVLSFLARALGSAARVNSDGAFLDVQAPVGSIEDAFGTKLSWFKHSGSGKRALRCTSALRIPAAISQHITFITLNSPVMTLANRAVTASSASGVAPLSVSPGNNEAMVYFKPLCADGNLNQFSPPCISDAQPPSFAAVADQFANNRSDPFPLLTEPLDFALERSAIYCYNSYTKATCGGAEGNNCTCAAKVSPLPKYTQLRVAVLETGVLNKTHLVGNSSYFALTDLATPDVLARLYNIPTGLAVRHGSNQSCAEFYGPKESFSNADLLQYLALAGLPPATIDPINNVFGDSPNNQSAPGGEGQLDVEVLLGLAVDSPTFFYNFNDANPNSASNEGFLSFVNTVLGQKYPPLVFSVSYGDVEANVFNASNPGSAAYGAEVDFGFAQMGLRGLTVIFSSGDDGIGNSIIRTDEDLACSQAWPAWPASSPYVLSVGATMMTNKALPVCGQSYSSSVRGQPLDDYLLVDCTELGETVCSPVFGGVITSGGGFSNVYSRAHSSPWQQLAVQKYLSTCSTLPPAGYFNSTGRAYPDVSTYGSQFLVVLNGQVIRESGTSASAPVMAAMITLWNDMRLAYSMPPLGFINPFLYAVAAAHPEAFNDITTGNNACGAGGGLTTASW